MRGTIRRVQRLASIAVVTLLVAPGVAAGLSAAGVLTEFSTGDGAFLRSFDPSAVGEVLLPNPSRAVDVSVSISTDHVWKNASAGAPERGWWAEVAGCATNIRSLSPFQVNALTAEELANATTLGGPGWVVNGTVAKPAVLLEFNVSGLPPLPYFESAQLRNPADSPDGPYSVLTAAYSTVPGAPPQWRDLNAPFGPIHPPVRREVGYAFIDLLVVPTNESARWLQLNGLALDLWWPDTASGTTLVLNETGEPLWSFAGPGGLPADFGWSNKFDDGSRAASLSSTGSEVQGSTPALFIPSYSGLNQAFVDLTPVPAPGSASGDGGGAVYRVLPGGTTVQPSAPSIGPVPIVAHPTNATITLYGLTAHGVVDARQETEASSTSVGNLTAFEQSAAQTVTVERDGDIEAVSLRLANASGHAVGPLLLELRNTSAGAPGPNVLAVGFANETLARLGGWINFTLSRSVAVTAGEQVALVLVSRGALADETWEWRGRNGVATDPYANGSAFLSANASGAPPWVPQANTDMAFRMLMGTPFDEADIPSLSVAGEVAAPTRLPNFVGPSTGWRFQVATEAVQLEPDFSGGGFWNATIVNALGYAVDFLWTAALNYEQFPRNVELGLGNRTAFLTIPELDRPLVIDAGDIVMGLVHGTWSPSPWNGTMFALFPVRVRADGPAGLVVSNPDVTYVTTVNVTGLAPALNPVLAAAASGNLSAAATFALRGQGNARAVLTNLRILYSEPPTALPGSPFPVQVSEGAQNATIADLFQLFVDDLDGFRLAYAIDHVTPNFPAGVFENAVDANLTLTLTDGEYTGPVTVWVRATDSSGLSTLRPFDVTVLGVDDPPEILPLPEIALTGTTGTFDLAPYLHDNDTALGALSLTFSSVFATLSGTVLTFDYRTAPATLLVENATLTVRDATSTVNATVRIAINNAGRPLATPPPPITAVLGHNYTLSLDPFVTDDRDNSPQLRWEFLRVIGVGSTPGDGSASLRPARAVEFRGTLAGDVEVALTVTDRDGNVGSATFLFHVVANQPPSLGALDGSQRSIPSGGEVRIDLAAFFSDNDDVMANITFSLAWDNGTIVTADVQGGVLVIRSLGAEGGRARVTVVATDPAGDVARANVEVDVQPAPSSSTSLLLPILSALFGLGLVAYLWMALQKGKARRASLGGLNREEGEMEADEDRRKTAESPDGLDETDSEKMMHKLDTLEKEASLARDALPPVTIIAPPIAAVATQVVLAYRDGRPISWVCTSAPAEADTQRVQELAAALEQRARLTRPGGNIEGETVSLGGKQFVLEMRAQLMMAALAAPGANSAPLRIKMRKALDTIFDANSGPLKRWDGSRAELKGVDDHLEGVFKAGE